MQTYSDRELMERDDTALDHIVPARHQNLIDEADVALAALDEGASIACDVDPHAREALAWIGDLFVGIIAWDTHSVVEVVEAHPALRRRGIGRSLWDAVNAAGIRLRHSPQRTSAGHAWARAMGGPLPRCQQADATIDSVCGWPLHDLRADPVSGESLTPVASDPLPAAP